MLRKCSNAKATLFFRVGKGTNPYPVDCVVKVALRITARPEGQLRERELNLHARPGRRLPRARQERDSRRRPS